jgi:hypothetical protein
MKIIAFLILAAALPLAAQDAAAFHGTISGMGAADPAPYVPDPTLADAGGSIILQGFKPDGSPSVVVLYSAVPVIVDQPLIAGIGFVPFRPARHYAPVARVAARRR